MDNFYSEQRRKPRKLLKVNECNDLSKMRHINKRYWNNVLQQMDTCTKSPEEESKTLAQVLPKDMYNHVCTILKIPKADIQYQENEKIKVKLPRRQVKEPQISSRKCLYINRELDSDTDVEYCPSDEDDKPNIYQELLNKPVREQITWPTRYLQPEKEEEKSLVKKADDLTNRIANEFCEYMKQLGGDQQSKLFTPKAIKELFQIEFDTHVARSLRILPKELPCVDDKVAAATGIPEASCDATLDREISKDIKAEQRPNRTIAFGQSLPMLNQYRGPRNNTHKLWRTARHVPKDLVTLKTVWEGITNLKSVKEYCRWMIGHPEHRRPEYLSSLGLFDPAVLNSRLTFEAEYQRSPAVQLLPEPTSGPTDDFPAPIDNIHKRLSDLAESL